MRQKRRDDAKGGAGGGGRAAERVGESEASVATGTEEREADERE